MLNVANYCSNPFSYLKHQAQFWEFAMALAFLSSWDPPCFVLSAVEEKGGAIVKPGLPEVRSNLTLFAQ